MPGIKPLTFVLLLLTIGAMFAVEASVRPLPAESSAYGCLDARRSNAVSYWDWSSHTGSRGVFTVLQTDWQAGYDLIVIRGLFGRDFTGHSIVVRDRLILAGHAGSSGSEDTFYAFVSLGSGGFTSFSGVVIGQQTGFQRFTSRLLSCYDNLAPNPGFEISGNSPLGWRFVPGVMEGGGTWSTETRHTGTRSVELHGPLFPNIHGQCIPPHAAGHWETIAPIPIDSSQVLRLTAWHLGETVGPATGLDALRIVFLNAQGNDLGERSIASVSNGPGWQPASLTVTPPYPAGTTAVRLALLASFVVFLGPCPDDEISNWYDNVSLLSFPGLPPPVP